MIDIEDITRQVLCNCDISDSMFSGYFSVCGLALRLRDLYKWENKLEPWKEKDSSEILDWIGERESKWERLAGEKFRNITISGTSHDPFDTSSINKILEPAGIIYGAGYARGLKPTFFLADLEEKRMMDTQTVYILGREYARDLLTLPALSNDGGVLVRKESARYYLWDKIFFIRKSARPALRVALEQYGIADGETSAIYNNLDRIAEGEIDTFIYHELGEAGDTVFDRDLWREIIAAFPHSAIELLARAVKDLLADTNARGTLIHIVKMKRTASLALYVAFLEGLLKELFPEIVEAFHEFAKTKNWTVVERAVDSGLQTAKQHARTISSVYSEGKQSRGMEWAEKELEKRLLIPLGVGT